MRKILKKILIGAAASVAGAIGIGHISGQIIKAISPTPEEFAVAERGKPYGPKATKVLQDNSDIFVINPNSLAFQFYKYTHPLFWITHSTAKPESAFAMTNRALFRVLGEYNFISAGGMDGLPLLEGLFPEKMRDPEFADLKFSAEFFHELGHHAQHKKLGDSLFKLPILDQELHADLYQIDALSDEFNQKNRPYSIAFRAVSQFGSTHDTLPYLSSKATLPPATIQPEKRLEYLDSAEAFSQIVVDCLTPQQIDLVLNRNQMPAGMYKTIYDCLKPHEELMKKHSSDFNPAERAAYFIKGYEYLRDMK